MAKEKEEETKKEIKTLVVSQLPKVDARSYIDDEKNEFVILTTEEALTEILEKVRKLEKVWGK